MLHSPSSACSCREAFHPLDRFCGPLLDALQQLRVCPALRTPHLDAVLQVTSHQHRAEGQDHLPQPPGHASFDAAQDMVGLLGCEGTSLAYVQLLSTCTTRSFLAVLYSHNHQLVLVVGVAVTQV